MLYMPNTKMMMMKSNLSASQEAFLTLFLLKISVTEYFNKSHWALKGSTFC